MKFNTILAVLATSSLLGTAANAQTIELSDPEGDDNGPGTFVYPTDRVYERGSFDLTGVTIEVDGDEVELRVNVAARIEDPWNSKEWDGNGFSLQYAQVYFDTARGDSEGHTAALPGMNLDFATDQAWNRVVLVSPQGAARLRQELAEKAAEVADAVIIPDSTRASGRTLTARFPLSALGSSDPTAWGVQVLLQSNEGFPTSTDLLTRPVNEFEGAHRFGGGNDYNCDPHAIDMLAGSAQGEAAEAEAQHAALGAFTCDAEGNGTRAVVPM